MKIVLIIFILEYGSKSLSNTFRSELYSQHMSVYGHKVIQKAIRFDLITLYENCLYILRTHSLTQKVTPTLTNTPHPTPPLHPLLTHRNER